MTLSRMILVATVCSVPFAVASLPAYAATAHNIQTGANTKNANDPGVMGANKMMMEKHHMKRHHHMRKHRMKAM